MMTLLWIRADAWYEGSFKIVLKSHVQERHIALMKTRGIYSEGRTIFVPSGRAKDTHCGMLEFKDCFGMPFGWNKSLVEAVIVEDGYLLWD